MSCIKQNNYILKRTDNSKYQYLLLSTSLCRLEDYIQDVESELSSKKIAEGFIIFDLLLNNNLQDRFYQCYFNGKCFEISKLKKIDTKTVDKRIVQISANFYTKHIQLFDSLFFSNDFKKNLKNNLLSFL